MSDEHDDMIPARPETETDVGDEYLATGFVDVDRSENPAAFHNCLSLIDSLPYYRESKQRSYELLGLAPGLTVLEVGCGLGDDAIRIAELVAPGGSVVGVDASARMIELASARAPIGLPLKFLQADARNLPFEDAVFDRCRVDRTLQHIERPDEAIAGMVRVLAPGGTLLAYDNDWGTFTVSGPDRSTGDAMAQYWGASFVNPTLGRDLARLFAAAGLVDITVIPSVSVITEFETADRVYNLRQTAQRAAKQGIITGEAAAAWLAGLENSGRRGSFHCELTAFTVTGKKPAGQD